MLNLTIFASKLNRLEWIGLRENAQKKLWILTPTWGFLEILSSSNSRINMPFSGIPVPVDKTIRKSGRWAQIQHELWLLDDFKECFGHVFETYVR